MNGRFVILTHDHPFLHWDLMLEDAADLRTWRLLAEPDSTTAPIPAEPLSRHRRTYLDYEGPVSGCRGTVTKWDAGNYLVVTETDDELRLRLAGKKLFGVFDLVTSPDSSTDWAFYRHRE